MSGIDLCTIPLLWICHLGDIALRCLSACAACCLPAGSLSSVMHGCRSCHLSSRLQSTPTSFPSSLQTADMHHSRCGCSFVSPRCWQQAKGGIITPIGTRFGCCLCHWIYTLAGCYPACMHCGPDCSHSRPKCELSEVDSFVVSAVSHVLLSGTCLVGRCGRFGSGMDYSSRTRVSVAMGDSGHDYSSIDENIFQIA
jgi:hypothetical protein